MVVWAARILLLALVVVLPSVRVAVTLHSMLMLMLMSLLLLLLLLLLVVDGRCRERRSLSCFSSKGRSTRFLSRRDVRATNTISQTETEGGREGGRYILHWRRGSSLPGVDNMAQGSAASCRALRLRCWRSHEQCPERETRRRHASNTTQTQHSIARQDLKLSSSLPHRLDVCPCFT